MSRKHEKDLSRILVLDCEATCWETRDEQGDRPNEIIEIGICEFIIKTKEVQKIKSYPVRPRFTTVSEFCTSLTGWTQEQVDAAHDIANVLKTIGEDYEITSKTSWASYGAFDYRKLSSDKDLRGSVGWLYGIAAANNPIAQMTNYINIKNLMAYKEGLKNELGMDRALKFYNETLEGRHHNGADDAANIAKILRKVLYY